MAFTRTADYYDLVANGLRNLGYAGDGAFEMYIEDTFANKYNFKGLAQMGFSLSERFSIDPRWVQAEAQSKQHSLAAFVNIDSDGPAKSVLGMELQSGTMPTFKHEVLLDRAVVDEQLMLARELGRITDNMTERIMQLFKTRAEMLLGGNYNTMAFMRHQIVSEGKLSMNANNNPFGVDFEADFGKFYKAENTIKSHWYTKVALSGSITQETPVTNGTVNPIQVLRDVKYNAEQKGKMPAGHWEISKTTWNDLLKLPYFREMYVAYSRPEITDATNKKILAGMTPDDELKAFIEKHIGAEIKIIDAIFRIEKFDKTTGADDSYIDGFKEGVMVYVPDGELGEVQCRKPVVLSTPGSRIAYLDGGRTLMRSTFDDKHMKETIETEVTGILVPNKTRWMYYVEIKK